MRKKEEREIRVERGERNRREIRRGGEKWSYKGERLSEVSEVKRESSEV